MVRFARGAVSRASLMRVSTVLNQERMLHSKNFYK